MPIKLATRGKYGGVASLASWGKAGILNLVRIVYQKIKRQIFRKDNEYRIFTFDNSYKIFILDNEYRLTEFDNFRRILIKEDEYRSL